MAEIVLKLMKMAAGFALARMLKFRKDVENLGEKLERLKALLADAAQLPVSGPTEDWLKKLETVVMEADDCLDELQYEVLRREIQKREMEETKVRNFPFALLDSFSFRFQMALKIKNMNETLENILQESKNHGIDKTEVDSTSIGLNKYWEQGPLEGKLEVLGREKEMSSLVEVLLSHDHVKDFSVIGLIGMGGIGKTTLAHQAFENVEVARFFDNRMWITVSDSLIADDLLDEMLRCLNPFYLEEFNGEAIMEKLQHYLNGKRFLLVLDDVSSVDKKKWDCTRRYLLGIGASKGNKILVTARSYAVLHAMSASFICDLDPLSDDDSWTLFARIAFADKGKERYPELVDIGNRLVKRCRGLPLTIKTLAGLLYSRKSMHEWSMIETSETWVHSSWIFAALQLSYDSLPSLSVRQCFAYCSIFPKNAVIEREKITQQWMAQGFLNASKEFQMEMEELGNYYFHILLQSAFFEEIKKDDFNNIISFKMHDIVHDFALHVASNFCVTLNGGMESAESFAIHASVISKEGNSFKIPKGKFRKLRTLYLIGGVLNDKLTGLSHVRVLVVESFEVRELPTSIGNLKHLRYLDISRTMIRRLPHSIIKLQNLQTLRLHTLEEFPTKFHHLINLRHLYIEYISCDLSTCFIPGIRHLVSLQTLPYFVVGSDMGYRIDELQYFPDLKGNLKIFALQNIKHQEEAVKANLSKRSKIESLEFHWDDAEDESNYMDILDALEPHSNLKGLTIVNFHGSTFPLWVIDNGSSLFRNLVHFKLENCNRCDKIPVIGHLPSLKIVEIHKLNNVQVIGNSFYGWEYLNTAGSIGHKSTAFPSLRRLSVSGMPKLVEWSGAGNPSASNICPKMEEFTIGGCLALTHLPDMSKFASLRHLFISTCERLASLPEGIGSLASLEYLGISQCPSLALIPDAGGLASLRILSIVDCRMLKALPHGLENCRLLESLSVLSCPALLPEALCCLSELNKLEIGYFSDELNYFPWPYACDDASTSAKSAGCIQSHYEFISLTSLKLYGWPKLSSLPEQLQHLPVLRDLTICLFDGLVALPEWLCNIQTLEILELQECSNLTSFPSSGAMKCLIKLQSLKILYCPRLEDRCIEGSGSEWEKIAHVPQIYINNKLVQSQR